MDNNIIPEVVDHIKHLPHNLQRQVLNYVKELKKIHETEVHGEHLLRFAGSISAEDLKIMSDVIEKDCEQVDLNEW